MIFYDIALQKWVRKPGSSSTPWETLTIPIGAIYELCVFFCSGSEIITPPYDSMSLSIKAVGDASGAKLAEADADSDSGDGSVLFKIDTSETPNQTNDLTPCYLQILYEADSTQYLTTLADCMLQNNYTL